MNIKQVLFSFDGRITRREYWLKGILPALGIFLITTSACAAIENEPPTPPPDGQQMMTLYGYARVSVREPEDRLVRAGGSLGPRPSLTEQQRAYIQAERSKGVSQRELAQCLEISH